ncbi:MAG: LapA family protein [Azoarcus sp.]|nr:LapA family protein [Azoarcus sp.]
MRALIWFFRLVLFLLLFGFAVKNDHVVSLYFFFDSEWRLPLVFIIWIAFVVGALLGMTATVIPWFSLRREVSRLKKQLDQAQQASAKTESTANPPATGIF